MKEIFAIGEEVDNAIEKIEFAQLRSLSLGNLPEVTSFCREVETPSASPNRQVSQEESTVYCSSEITLDISTLLFNEKVALPNLEALEISEINVDKIWHYNHLPNNENDQLGIPTQQPLSTVLAISFSTRRDELSTYVGGIRIAFNKPDLCSILGIAYGGLDLYTARKELSFSDFRHVDGVRNICRRRDLSDDICSLSFRSQFLPFQVQILYIILQHMVTPRQGHTDEITRLDIHLLDSLIRRRHPIFLETRKLGREIISAIGFFKKRGKWEKTTSSKNEDTLLVPEDDRMLNDVYSEDELPDFHLGARPRVPRRAAAPAAPAAAASQDDEPTETAVPPAASAVPKDRFQQLLNRVDGLSQQQQQLRYDFATFRE
ncbi:hypothetical protein WN944_006748 [Citrus x changshan-huyou]|uniref:Uncharacterized protein n=1 Tax=Citrus x changshan-huyou TaxID=2935761 RepID=A0AAP0MLX9_9ROSI